MRSRFSFASAAPFSMYRLIRRSTIAGIAERGLAQLDIRHDAAVDEAQISVAVSCRLSFAIHALRDCEAVALW